MYFKFLFFVSTVPIHLSFDQAPSIVLDQLLLSYFSLPWGSVSKIADISSSSKHFLIPVLPQTTVTLIHSRKAVTMLLRTFVYSNDEQLMVVLLDEAAARFPSGNLESTIWLFTRLREMKDHFK